MLPAHFAAAVPGVAVGPPAGETTEQKASRELYVGNLATGIAAAEVLRELFNTALAPLVPDATVSHPHNLLRRGKRKKVVQG
jgi:hypothetical protein